MLGVYGSGFRGDCVRASLASLPRFDGCRRGLLVVLNSAGLRIMIA